MGKRGELEKVGGGSRGLWKRRKENADPLGSGLKRPARGRHKEMRPRKEKREGRGDPSLRENRRMEGWRSQTQEGRPPGPNFAKRPKRA